MLNRGEACRLSHPQLQDSSPLAQNDIYAIGRCDKHPRVKD